MDENQDFEKWTLFERAVSAANLVYFLRLELPLFRGRFFR
jgi:hypothetical protein